ncbi:MAG: AEC family transporter [Pseudomonadota bacterium]
MLAIFSSIMPIFLLIFLGNLLRRAPLFDDGFWQGLNRLGFYVLYPVLLFTSIYRASFEELDAISIGVAFMIALALMAVLILASWPFFRLRGMRGPQFSSIFQSSVRWNGFIALAIADALYSPEAVALVALIMAVIIIPIQLSTITVIIALAETDSGKRPPLLKNLATNPLMLAVAFAIVLKLLPFALPEFAMGTLDLLARAALGMGLLGVGAGLLLDDLAHPKLAVFLPIALKLFVLPILVIGTGLAFGVTGDPLTFMALCAAMPTAMNGYVVAKELGGDARFYAAVATLQTAISFFSIPAVLTITELISGGG